MTDIVTSTNSPHDALVAMIAKAIDTGHKITARKSFRDNTFYAGRISAFIYSAAIQAQYAYGANFADAKHRIRREVEDVHLHWSEEDLRDAGHVGNQATLIAGRVLDASA